MNYLCPTGHASGEKLSISSSQKALLASEHSFHYPSRLKLQYYARVLTVRLAVLLAQLPSWACHVVVSAACLV